MNQSQSILLTQWLLWCAYRLRSGAVQSECLAQICSKLAEFSDLFGSTVQNSWHIMPMRSMEIEMPTRNVVLTETQTQLIDRLVADGRFQNASEAMRAGLRLLEREEVEMTDLRTRLAAGLREARAGAFADGTGEDAIRRAFAAAREAS